MPIRARKRKNGKVVFDVRAEYGGIRVQRTVQTTITDAKRVESKLLQELISGRYEILKNRENPTFRHYAQEYIKNVTWQKSYNRTVISVNHLIRYFGRLRLTDITDQDFINYRTVRLQKIGPATVNREYTCLNRMLNIAVKSDKFQISKNPLDNVTQLKEPPAANRVLTMDEYHKLLYSAPEYFKRIIFFASHSGMRKMEILNLTFRQIRMWLKNAEIELVETKSGEKEYVPLDRKSIELIWEIAEDKGIDLRKLRDSDKDKHLFTGIHGQRLKSVRRPMETTFKRAGIELRPFHTFRHFWTKMMFEAGNDPATIQKVGRWRDFETMLKYCYTTKSQEHDAVNKLSEHLERKGAKILPWRGYSGNEAKNGDS